nr:hypothetical protein [Parafrankia sp. BMG5.11]
MAGEVDHDEVAVATETFNLLKQKRYALFLKDNVLKARPIDFECSRRPITGFQDPMQGLLTPIAIDCEYPAALMSKCDSAMERQCRLAHSAFLAGECNNVCIPEAPIEQVVHNYRRVFVANECCNPGRFCARAPEVIQIIVDVRLALCRCLSIDRTLI